MIWIAIYVARLNVSIWYFFSSTSGFHFKTGRIGNMPARYAANKIESVVFFCQEKAEIKWTNVHTWETWWNIQGQPWNPPTPALAKAGAAPGTTAGVELFFFPNALHFPRATQAIALSSPPRSHSGHSNFCALPTSHSCHSTLGFYGVPKRNKPRQTLCSSDKSLRPWQCPFKIF